MKENEKHFENKWQHKEGAFSLCNALPPSCNIFRSGNPARIKCSEKIFTCKNK